MDNGAIGFFLFFVILIIIWIFAMGGCVRERKSLGVYEGLEDKKFISCLKNCGKYNLTNPGVSQQNCIKCKINCCNHHNNGKHCSESGIIDYVNPNYDITPC